MIALKVLFLLALVGLCHAQASCGCADLTGDEKTDCDTASAAVDGSCKAAIALGVDGSPEAEETCKAVKGALTGPCGAGCFPSSATVELEDGAVVTMASLKEGDRVRVSNDQFSEVMLFSHQEMDALVTFVRLETQHATVVLTPGHYLYVNGRLQAAGTVKAGDHLTLANNTQAEVTAVSMVRATGLFNPHTMDGDIIVDNVKTSTYTTAVPPALAHALLFPVRALRTAGISLFDSNNMDVLREIFMKYMPTGFARYL